MQRQAELLACSIELGLAEAGDAVDWADSMIAAIEGPSHLLIDVSTAVQRHPTMVVDALRELSGKPRDEALLRDLLKVFGKKLRAEPSSAWEIAAKLYRLARDDEWLIPDDLRYQLLSFDDGADLARVDARLGQEIILEMQSFLDGDV